MSAAPDPIWRAHDDNGRPVHAATMTVFDQWNQIADTWLDARFTKRGCNPRFSNIRGEFCNSQADGTPAGLHLMPGEYTVVIARGDGRRLGTPIRITVKPEGGQVIEVRPEPVQAGPPITIIARGESGQAGSPVGITARGDRDEVQRIAGELRGTSPRDLSNISEAIRELLEKG